MLARYQISCCFPHNGKKKPVGGGGAINKVDKESIFSLHGQLVARITRYRVRRWLHGVHEEKRSRAGRKDRCCCCCCLVVQVEFSSNRVRAACSYDHDWMGIMGSVGTASVLTASSDSKTGLGFDGNHAW